MAIPSARAEVMRWFAPTSAQEYFTEDPESREPNEALDALIVPGEQSETHVEVHSVAEEDIFSEIAKALESAELGDTMFDGENLYIRMRVNGLGMLPAIEAMTGGNLTKTIVPPELTTGYFEDNKTPPEFLSGEVPFWMDAEIGTQFTFADGTQINGGQIAADYGDIQSLLDSLRRDNLDNGWYSTPEQFAEINKREVEYLRDRTVNACITTGMNDPYISRENPSHTLLDEFLARADENGRVTVTVSMNVVQDPGDGSAVSVLEATLGEVTVDLAAYRSLEKTALLPDGNEAVFAPEDTFLTVSDWKADETGGMRFSVKNVPVNLDGLTFTPLDGAYIDALGIRNLQIRLTPPKDWTPEMLAHLNVWFLQFEVRIDGKRLGYPNGERMTVQEDGSVLICIDSIDGVPLDELKNIRTVALIPILDHATVKRVREVDTMGEPGVILSEEPLEPNVTYWAEDLPTEWGSEQTENRYPQYAITVLVN